MTVAIPFAPFAGWLGFVPLPGPVLAGLLAITALYVMVSEVTKSWLFDHGSRGEHRRGSMRLQRGRAAGENDPPRGSIQRRQLAD